MPPFFLPRRLFPLADLFPDGKVLLVSSGDAPGDHRSFEGNSVIFDPATGHTTHFVLGVGIEDIGIDTTDRIWVGYNEDGARGSLILVTAKPSLATAGWDASTRQVNKFGNNRQALWPLPDAR